MIVAGAVLAAGGGRRMGRPKGELVLDGVRLLDRAVAVLRAGGCAPVVVVVRAGVEVPDARAVVNPAPERGQRSSLELAVAAVEPVDPVAGRIDALAVLLVDAPGVGADAVATVRVGWRPGRIAVATYAGRRGHPTVMAPEQWRAALERAAPDEGAKAYLRAHPDLVDEIAVAGDPTDLDTPADVERWLSSSRESPA